MAEKKLSKKDVVKAFWRWTFFSHANYNYERLEATGLVHAFKHVINFMEMMSKSIKLVLKDICSFLIQNPILEA